MVSCGNKVFGACAMLWLLYCIYTLLYLCINAPFVLCKACTLCTQGPAPHEASVFPLFYHCLCICCIQWVEIRVVLLCYQSFVCSLVRDIASIIRIKAPWSNILVIWLTSYQGAESNCVEEAIAVVLTYYKESCLTIVTSCWMLSNWISLQENPSLTAGLSSVRRAACWC